MKWRLELVGEATGEAPMRVRVDQLGEIVSPVTIDDVGLPHATAMALLSKVQRAVASA